MTAAFSGGNGARGAALSAIDAATTWHSSANIGGRMRAEAMTL